jgi:hypothetical protein
VCVGMVYWYGSMYGVVCVRLKYQGTCGYRKILFVGL